MAALGSILAWRFQGAPEDGYAVQMGDEGAFIAFWNEALMGRAVPTSSEIASWDLPASKYYRKREIRLLADTDYDAIFAIDGKEMGMYKDRLIIKMARGQALTAQQISQRDQMAAIVQSVDDKMTAITNATTVAEVEAIGWP